MSYKKLSAFVVVLFCLSSFRLGSSKTFQKLLNEAKMAFNLPEGFHEVGIIKNIQMGYEFAMQDSSGNLEVRYTIRPIDTLEQKKNHMDFDNELTNFTIFNSILFNISDQVQQIPAIMKMIRNMPPTAVAREFNGDDARVSRVNLGKEFGQDYKYGFVINLHKKSTANAFIYLMAKDSTTLMHITKPLFYALKFK